MRKKVLKFAVAKRSVHHFDAHTLALLSFQTLCLKKTLQRYKVFLVYARKIKEISKKKVLFGTIPNKRGFILLIINFIDVVMENGKDKIEMILAYLGLKAPTFAKRIGVNYQRINDIQNGKTKRISYELAKRICHAYPEFSMDWLVGETESGMLERQDASDMIKEEPKENLNPYFEEFTIQGGIGHGDGGESAIAPSGYMGVPGIQQTPDIPFFRVRGNSMLNTADPGHSIPNGSWVALKRVMSSAIRWGEVYALETVDGPIVKKIMPSEKHGHIKCVSFNSQEYPPFDLPVSDIVGESFYLVMGVVGVQVWH